MELTPGSQLLTIQACRPVVKAHPEIGHGGSIHPREGANAANQDLYYLESWLLNIYHHTTVYAWKCWLVIIDIRFGSECVCVRERERERIGG